MTLDIAEIDLEHVQDQAEETALTGTATHLEAFAELEARATDTARAAVLATTPRNTTLARGAAMRAFASWLRHAHGLELAIPVLAAVLLDFVNQAADGFPEDIERGMLEDGAKKPGPWSVATVEARVRHLSKAHKLAGIDSPAADVRVRERIAAMKRAAAQARTTRNRHEAITLTLLEQLLDTCDRDTLTGLRDRAVMLFAWASGGRRRSEAAIAQVEDLRQDGDEYTYRLPTSKTDQEGAGMVVPVAGRAAAALRTWLAAAKISEGPIFRKVLRGGRKVSPRPIHPATVNVIVKAAAARAGLAPTRFGAHSLRSGFVTTAGRSGVSLQDTMALTGHKTIAVASRYHHAGAALEHPAARLAG